MDILKSFSPLTICLNVFVCTLPDEATSFLIYSNFEF
jgi:hypothetical protein